MLLDQELLDNSAIDGGEGPRECLNEFLLGISNCRRGPGRCYHKVECSAARSSLAECGPAKLLDPVYGELWGESEKIGRK